MNPVKSLEGTFRYVPGFDKLKINGTGTRIFNKGKEMKIYNIKNKNSFYPTVTIDKNTYRISRLVALAFVPNPKNLPFAYHLNGDTEKNWYTNLAWGNHSDIRNAHKTDGERSNLSKKQRKEIAKRLEAGEHAKDLAVEFNTSHASITRIRKALLDEKHGSKRYHTEVKQLAYDLFEAGVTPLFISKNILNIRYETILRWYKMDKEKLINSPCGHLTLNDVMI